MTFCKDLNIDVERLPQNPGRKRCPKGDCGYSEPPARNVEVEEMISNYELEVNCKYYHEGCQQMELRAAMPDHEARCGCREVLSLYLSCGEQNLLQ